MPIITQIGRKSWKLRLLIYSIYTVLTVGAVTMVYPFLMMLSLSTTSLADFKENRFIPRYYTDDDALYRKFAATKYPELDQFNMRHGTRYPSFDYGGQFQSISPGAVNWPRIVAVPFDLSDPRIKARVDDHNEFKRAFINDNWVFTECQYITTRALSTLNPLLDRYVDFLIEKYGSLHNVNRAYLEEVRELREIYAIRERPTFRTYLPADTPKLNDWQEFKKRMAAENLEYVIIGDIEPEWGRFLQSKYSGEEKFNEVFGTSYTAFYSIPLPFTAPHEGTTETERLWRELWVEFARDRVPLRYMTVRDPDERYRDFLRARYGEVEPLNTLYHTEYGSFDEIAFPSEINYNGSITTDIYLFVGSEEVAPEDILIRSPRWHWREFLRRKYGGVEEADRAHSISYASWGEIALPRRFPLHQTLSEREDWKAFVLTLCPLDDLLGNIPRRRLVEFLRGEYGSVEKLNEAWGTSYAALEKVKCPRRGTLNAAQQADLRRMFEQQAIPLFDVKLPESVPDALYRDFLQGRYASIGDYNTAIRLYPDEESVRRPIAEIEWADYSAVRRDYKRQFITGNYKAVISYMAINGRAFGNTAILCGAMVLAALTVNPLCAYALSRFQLSYANSILLFLLATMAFPVAVTQIPNFLMLKNLSMLNTYWALILPGLANGYSIFLLKGFFDSLPQELFEAGLIDGASEVQMFYRIALPLTTPILAVIALGAFTLAYGQFMWAFIVCQNPKYWTIMVFLYQFQQDYSVPLVMAGLVLASLPTLVVFIAAQKVILRGIVVPQMK